MASSGARGGQAAIIKPMSGATRTASEVGLRRIFWRSAMIWCLFASIQLVAAAETARITSSLELKQTSGLLRQVARVFSNGFTRAEADALTREIDQLRPDQPRSWTYKVTYQNAVHDLQVRALLDDLGMVDLDFIADQAIAPAVRAAVDGYLNGR